jgi:hypothetical protein
VRASVPHREGQRVHGGGNDRSSVKRAPPGCCKRSDEFDFEARRSVSDGAARRRRGASRMVEADTGNSPITSYKIMRGTTSGGETLLTTVAGRSNSLRRHVSH